MLWVPGHGVKTITNGGIVGTLTPGTGLTSNATTLLDGAVTEIISSGNNNQDSWGIYIWITGTGINTTACEACCDILIGGATDDVLISALICGHAPSISSGMEAGHHYFFPLHIPQGKRLAATLASVRTSITAQIVVTLYGGTSPPWQVGRKVTTYGAQVNNARGKAITPTTSGGAASATEMTASTTEDHFAFLPGFQPATDTTVLQGVLNIGIGVGAATEERIGSWWYAKDTIESITGPFPAFPAFRDVVSGSRLTILSSESNASNDTAQDALIYAVS